MKVGMTYDLKEEHPPPGDAPPDHNAEFDTRESVRAMEAAIEACGYQVRRIGDIYRLIDFLIEGKSVDIVFNMAEGLLGRGREAQVPAVLDAYGIPYTGSDPLTLALCLDKAMTKRVWRGVGLPTADFCVVSDLAQLERVREELPPFPLFVKPVHEGSSKGIGVGSIVEIEGERALRERVGWVVKWYRQPALVEEFLPGREFTVGILGNGGQARILEIGEVALVAVDRVHGIEQKEQWPNRIKQKLVPVDASLRGELADLALRAYHAVDCRDVGRVDLRLDRDGRPKLMEINPVAGLYPGRSSLPVLATMAGLSYEELLGEILEHALRRL